MSPTTPEAREGARAALAEALRRRYPSAGPIVLRPVKRAADGRLLPRVAFLRHQSEITQSAKQDAEADEGRDEERESFPYLESGERSLTKLGPDLGGRRNLIGVITIVALAIVAVVVGIVVVAKGVESSWAAIFGGSCFALSLVLYWVRSGKAHARAG